MDEKRARILSLELMEISKAAYLTTIDAQGFPQTRAMVNLRRKEQYPGLHGLFKEHDEDFMIYFSTNTSSEKIAHIKSNPKVSVYYCKPEQIRGVGLCGEIEIIMAKEIKEAIWQPVWEIYYPEGLDDPDYTVLRLFPSFAKIYHQLDRARFNIG